jgi:Ca-activated chloride channel family protein
MKKFAAWLLCALMTLGTFAQNKTYTGIVLDAANNHPLPGAQVLIRGTNQSAITDAVGRFQFTTPLDSFTLRVQFLGYQTEEQRFSRNDAEIRILMQSQQTVLKEVIVMGPQQVERRANMTASVSKVLAHSLAPPHHMERERYNTNDYSPINENTFHQVKNKPLSTFSSDVDRASYTQVRQMLNSGQLPPVDAVRVEELINYFDYAYPAPVNGDPVAIHTDLAACPWKKEHLLARIGLQGRKVPTANLPASNLVFLLDVSGSMDEENKLPLVKQAFKALVQQLRPQDRVAIVVYAGAAGMVLPSTSGEHKMKIIDALESLSAGGSTAGGQGIRLAYKTVMEHFIPKGNNRVILATDGDFNVGPSSDGELQRIIEQEREKGIFLSVLGFGMGNYKDNKLETLADKGNGNYAYIDNYEEARRTFVTEFGGTLFTIAKDVKLQVEFNPKFVRAYRLVGYENRLLNDEDFNDDKKDAGDMGAGHTVTALYEIVPVTAPMPSGGSVDPLKYQETAPLKNNTATEQEAFTVKMRYKEPDGKKSKLLEKVQSTHVTAIRQSPEDLRMAAAVAQFGMLLRSSKFSGSANYDNVIELAVSAKGQDPEGYRSEFIQLVKKAKLLQGSVAVK